MKNFKKKKDLALKPIYLNMKLNDNFNKNDSIKKDISSNDCIPIIIEEKKTLKLSKKLSNSK